MQKAMRSVASVAVLVLFSYSFAFGVPTLQRGDRWPQNAAKAVAVGDGHVFLGRGNVLTILDNNLGFVGSSELAGDIQGVFYTGNHVYAAMGQNGLQIVDVTVPADPAALPIGYAPDEGVAGVFVVGTDAYTVSLNRFAVVDVSNPAAPMERSVTRLEGLLVNATNLFVSGGIAAVADQVNGLHLLDVSNPTQPVRRSVTVIAGAWDVALSGNYAYVTSAAGGLDIVDISNPVAPALLGSFAPDNAKFMGITVAGSSAYVADENNGLRQVDVVDPGNPTPVQTFAGTRGAYSVVTSGSDIFVCDFTAGLQKILGGTYDPPAEAANLFIDESYYLYTVDSTVGSGDDQEGLRILDAYNLGNFVFKGFVATPGQAQGVFVVNGAVGTPSYAYVADGTSGLQIVDVSDKTIPVIVGSLDTPGTAHDVHVSGNFAYVADDVNGLRIVDISNKTLPSETGFYDTPGTAFAVVVSGNLAYVADGTGGLQIVDVSNPAAPVAGGFTPVAGIAYDVAVSGVTAYMAAGTGGLQIVNVSNPSSPVIAGSFDTAGDARGVRISGNYARIANGVGGLVTLDISDPAAPVKVDEWSVGTNGNARKVFSIDEYVFVAEDRAGAVVYKLSDVTPFTPAPFNPPDDSGSCFIGALAGRK